MAKRWIRGQRYCAECGAHLAHTNQSGLCETCRNAKRAIDNVQLTDCNPWVRSRVEYYRLRAERKLPLFADWRNIPPLDGPTNYFWRSGRYTPGGRNQTG